MKRAALAWVIVASLAGADESAIAREAARGHVALAREAAASGLAEEAIREWQEARALDPGLAEEAEREIASAGVPWSARWTPALHAAWLVHAARRRRHLVAVADRWAARAAARAAAGDIEGEWLAALRAVTVEPDHAAARRRLGERKFEGEWMSEERFRHRSAGRLEIGGEWLPAAEVQRRRSVWGEAWEVEGPHIRVRCNRTLAAAKATLARAEEAYLAFHREILGVVDPPALGKKLLVLDFATAEDLRAHCREVHKDDSELHPRIPGFYSWSDDAVHLMPLPPSSALTPDDVVRHECTHLAATHAFPLQGWINTRPQFWAWEGIASWMEAVENRDGKLVAGDLGHIRFRLAREALEAGTLVPLAEFTERDQHRLGTDYQQAAALADFFMTARGGALRPAFVELLRVVSSGKAVPGSFETAFGRTAGEFEAEFREHVKRMPRLEKGMVPGK